MARNPESSEQNEKKSLEEAAPSILSPDLMSSGPAAVKKVEPLPQSIDLSSSPMLTSAMFAPTLMSQSTFARVETPKEVKAEVKVSQPEQVRLEASKAGQEVPKAQVVQESKDDVWTKGAKPIPYIEETQKFSTGAFYKPEVGPVASSFDTNFKVQNTSSFVKGTETESTAPVTVVKVNKVEPEPGSISPRLFDKTPIAEQSVGEATTTTRAQQTTTVKHETDGGRASGEGDLKTAQQQVVKGHGEIEGTGRGGDLKTEGRAEPDAGKLAARNAGGEEKVTGLDAGKVTGRDSTLGATKVPDGAINSAVPGKGELAAGEPGVSPATRGPLASAKDTSTPPVKQDFSAPPTAKETPTQLVSTERSPLFIDKKVSLAETPLVSKLALTAGEKPGDKKLVSSLLPDLAGNKDLLTLLSGKQAIVRSLVGDDTAVRSLALTAKSESFTIKDANFALHDKSQAAALAVPVSLATLRQALIAEAQNAGRAGEAVRGSENLLGASPALRPLAENLVSSLRSDKGIFADPASLKAFNPELVVNKGQVPGIGAQAGIIAASIRAGSGAAASEAAAGIVAPVRADNLIQQGNLIQGRIDPGAIQVRVDALILGGPRADLSGRAEAIGTRIEGATIRPGESLIAGKIDPLTGAPKLDANGRPIAGALMPGSPEAEAAQLDLSRIRKLRMQEGEKRYLTGVEMAIALAIASAAVAKTRSNQTLTEGEGEASSEDLKALLEEAKLPRAYKGNQDANNTTTLASNAASVYKRPVYTIAHNDNLVHIAETLFHDADVAWLIADINKGQINEYMEDGKRIIELRSRQQIELPFPHEVQEFLTSRKKEEKGEKIVTFVSVSEIDRELLDSFLSTVVGAETKAGQSLPNPSSHPAVAAETVSGQANAYSERPRSGSPVEDFMANPAAQLMALVNYAKDLGQDLMPTMSALLGQGHNLRTYISKIDIVREPAQLQEAKN